MSELRLAPSADPAREARVPRVWTRLGAGRRHVDAVKIPEKGQVIVSACLAGIPCTHAAEAKTRPWALRLVAEGRATLVCPEVAGGLGVPRPEAEIQGGDGVGVLEGSARVVDVEGRDVTESYIRGAEAAVAAAFRTRATLAVLKARSPSCGCGEIYDGSFAGRRTDGDGVAAAALRRAGVAVASDEALET